MEPVSMIVTALIAGAAAGGQETVTQGIKDAYAGLRKALSRRFSERPPGRTALAEVERVASKSGTSSEGGPWRTVLEGEIVQAGAQDDRDVLTAAARLIELLDASGMTRVDLRGAQGVQVGDHNTQTNTFGSA